jgi:iron complex outermembrane receptor protein
MKEKNNYWKNSAAKFITSLAILLVLNLTVLADSNGIEGTVTYNGAPKADVSVELTLKSDSKIKFQTTTKGNGFFRFTHLLPGEYLISAKENRDDYPGVATAEVIVRVSRYTEINLVLSYEMYGEDFRINETVNISAGTVQNIDEVSKSVSVLDNREIENRNEIAVVDALRTVPGLRVQQSGGFGRLASIKTRGLRNQDTAVLIDGQRFRDPTAITGDASPFLSDLQLTNVSRVEVLRGSGSSLYGTNAIGGVFNIVTDADGDSTPRTTLLAEGGGLGMFRGRLNFAHRYRKFTYNLGAAHTNFSKGVDGDDAARNTSGQGRFLYEFASSARLSARFYASDAFVQLNSNPDTIGILPATGIVEARPLSREQLRRYENNQTLTNVGNATFIPDANDPDASQASRFFNFNIGFEGLIQNKVPYQLSYQNLTTRRSNFNGLGGAANVQPFAGATRSDFDGGIQTFRAKTDVAVKSNLLTFGYEFEHEKFGNDNFTGTFNSARDETDAAQRSHTLFVQDQFEAFDNRLQLSGAARAQFFTLETPSFRGAAPIYQNLNIDSPPNAYTADGSAAYFFRSTNTKIRAHVGNGYRVPSLYERFGSFFSNFFLPASFVPLGDPRLKPERSVAFDTGIDQSFQSNRVRLSATYFYTRLTDTIGFANSLTNDPFNRFFGYQNTKGGIARGGEFSAEFLPVTKTRIFTSYTFTNSDQRESQVAGSGILQTLGVPKHQFTAVVTQRFFERLTLNFDFVAVSSYLAPIFSNTTFQTRIYRFEGNRKGDLTGAYEFPVKNEKLRFRLFGTIENIFNQDYYENGFRTARAAGRGGLQLNF